jgi:hypothetical protein
VSQDKNDFWVVLYIVGGAICVAILFHWFLKLLKLLNIEILY